MTNRNTNIVHKSEKKLMKMAINEYYDENKIEKQSFFCVLIYVVAFIAISFSNNSTFFSFMLALYSLIITFFFEGVEWVKYKSKNGNSLIYKIVKYYTNILLFATLTFVIVCVPLYILYKVNNNLFENVINSIDSRVPNIMTSITFMVYFLSYYFRNHAIKRQLFIDSYIKKYGKHPF